MIPCYPGLNALGYRISPRLGLSGDCVARQREQKLLRPGETQFRLANQALPAVNVLFDHIKAQADAFYQEHCITLNRRCTLSACGSEEPPLGAISGDEEPRRRCSS